MLTFKFSCDKKFRWHDGSTVTLRHFHCQCAGWWRAVLSEGRPDAHGYSRGLTGLPPSEQRGSSWAATPSPACYHPRTLWTSTHSTTHWWDTHTHIYTHAHKYTYSAQCAHVREQKLLNKWIHFTFLCFYIKILNILQLKMLIRN